MQAVSCYQVCRRAEMGGLGSVVIAAVVLFPLALPLLSGSLVLSGLGGHPLALVLSTLVFGMLTCWPSLLDLGPM